MYKVEFKGRSIVKFTYLFVLPLLAGTLSLPMLAKADSRENLYMACGRQAHDAGISGAGAVSEFVAKCVAAKHLARNGDSEDHDVGEEPESKKGKKTKEKKSKSESKSKGKNGKKK
jgi:hypothetical protein